jgi:hypothetical protein
MRSRYQLQFSDGTPVPREVDTALAAMEHPHIAPVAACVTCGGELRGRADKRMCSTRCRVRLFRLAQHGKGAAV